MANKKTNDELLTTFNELVADQSNYGGKKYALAGQTKRESTDELFDDFGKGWLFGTMAKYCKRFRNLARERDLLKIGCYLYLLWLKKGFHVAKEGLKIDVLDTYVKQKEENFEPFLKHIQDIQNNHVLFFQAEKEADDMLGEVYDILKHWANAKWSQIGAVGIYMLYYKMFLIWQAKFSQVENHDTDTGKK